MRYYLIFSLLMILTLDLLAQDTINRMDNRNRKQGFWKKTDKNGKKIYEGQFRDDIPYGEFRYYYPEGKLKAISKFYDNGIQSFTITYFNNGFKMAEGRFINEKRDSLWKFYSEYDGKLVAEEMYLDGKKNGLSRTFYAGEGVAEILTWEEDSREGNWEQYFSDGKLKIKGTYKKNENEGEVTAYYPSGKVLYSGYYHNGFRIGTWTYYDVKGNIEKREYYKDGMMVKEEAVGIK